MRHLLSEAGQKFDYPLPDSPPVLHPADARILAPQTEAVTLVAHGGVTPREVANHANLHLLQVDGHVIGVALNNADLSAVGHDYHYRCYRIPRCRSYACGSYGRPAQEEPGSVS
jgi:Mrp family chromosome partitioning ATPase